MCVSNYDFNKLTIDVKLPKCNFSYNIQDLVNAGLENALKNEIGKS